MFDWAEIVVKAGDGGGGAISFRREKFVPFGGPDGGDGGDGGDGVIRADVTVTSLKGFKQKRFYRAEDGKGGGGKKKHGKKGKGVVLLVPVGTVVSRKKEAGTGDFIVDMEQPGQQVVARGGKGGLGNVHFSSAINQAPRVAQRGEIGEEQSIILELRLIADVGIIGYPNVGKSTLLATASAAKPKIASYPFTTREPVLGMVEVGQERLVLAEIPGLIEDAHLGRGLGHDFLRHIIRTRMLIHLIDGGVKSPVEDMMRVNIELSLFDSALAQKPQLVAVNKIDLPRVCSRLSEVKDAFSDADIDALFVSAATGEGVAELMKATMQKLNQVVAEEAMSKQVPQKVFRPQPKAAGISVHREGDIFVVEVPELRRIVAGAGVTSSEVSWQLQKRLASLGVSKALERAGIKPGDKVRCGALEWEWY